MDNIDFTGFRLEIFWTAIIILIRYFTGVRLENTWNTNLYYNYYILWDLDYRFGFGFLFILLD